MKPGVVCDALAALSRLAVDLPEVVELDVNPLLADETGVLALDARIAVKRPDAATPRLAIAPSGDQDRNDKPRSLPCPTTPNWPARPSWSPAPRALSAPPP